MISGFWGIHIEPGKSYSQVVENSYRISMAALGQDAVKGELNILKITVEEEEFILCNLVRGQVEQQTLDIVLSEGEEITFSCTGKSSMYLSGNYIDQDDFDSEMEEGESDYSDNEVSGLGAAALLDTIAEEDEEEDSDWEMNDAEDGEEPKLVEIIEETKEEKAPVEKTKGKRKAVEEPVQEDSKDDKENKAEPEQKPLTKKQRKELNKKKAAEEAAKKAEKEKEKKSETPATKETPKKQTDESKAGASPAKRTIAGGIVVQDIVEGKGEPCKKGQKVAMRYIGKLDNGKVFDSNTKGAPFKFVLGEGVVIKGWDLGVVGMRVGGQRKLTIPAKFAYGAQGAPPEIPKNATLHFDLKLINMK